MQLQLDIKPDKITLSQLEQYLAKAAWILKGPVGASDFKKLSENPMNIEKGI